MFTAKPDQKHSSVGTLDGEREEHWDGESRHIGRKKKGIASGWKKGCCSVGTLDGEREEHWDGEREGIGWRERDRKE